MLFGAQPKELTKALAFYGAAAPAGGTAGVFLGGVLTDVLSWEWVFLINIPIALIALAATPRLMPAAQAGRGSVDIAGAVTVTAGLAAAVFAIVRAPEEGWGSTVTIAVLAGAVVLLASFLVIQSKRKTPLVRLSIFRTPNLGAANVAQLLLGAAWIPMSASAWRTRLRSVSGCIPRSRATAAIGRPLSSASRTPCATSSSGYFFGRAITSASSPEDRNPRLEVSVRQ